MKATTMSRKSDNLKALLTQEVESPSVWTILASILWAAILVVLF
jgi:hypothetical protein